MARVKRGLASHRKHKKLLSLAQGYRMTRRKLVRKAKEAVLHAGQYAYVGRKDRKSQARREWILRINEALKLKDVSYSKFFAMLKAKKIELDRKILSQLVLEKPEVFEKFVKFTTA